MSYNFTDWANNRTFVINRKTKTLVKSFTNPQHNEAVKFIDSFPIPERYDYCTTSRNGLATSGMYPKNKTGNSQLEADLSQLEKPMTELQILRKYQALPEVSKLITLVNDESESVQIFAANRLVGYTNQAMKEANCATNDFGQRVFADGVYFDLSMDDIQKLTLLTMCEGQEQRIQGLMAEMELQNEFIR